jgi:hypothetical protein
MDDTRLTPEQEIQEWTTRFADCLEDADFAGAERAVRMVIAYQMIEEAHEDVR